jgi:DNA-directed RNA polymerase specialized sigma24 family protein
MGIEASGRGDVAGTTALLDAVGAGCEASWRQLVDRHLPMVHAMCAAFGLQAGAAAAVNQAVWLSLVEKLPGIRTPDAIGGWIAATTRGFCLDPRWAPERDGYTAATVGCSHRREPSTRPDAPTRPGRPDLPDRSERPEWPARPTVAGAFARLGAQCQRLLRLAATQPQPSPEDLAAALDLATTTVEPTLTRCLHRLGRMVGIDDQVAWAELQATIADCGSVPGEWRAAAQTAFGWLRSSAQPAERLYDASSPTGPSGLAGAAIRQVRCVTREDGVELTLDIKGDEIVMQGDLLSGSVAKVAVHWPDGELATSTDERGAFRILDLPRAPLYVHVDAPAPFKTPWLIP